MKAVGIITCFADNYGACLQAYALQESIEKIGYSCYIINYVEPACNPSRKTLKLLPRIGKSNAVRIIRSKIDYGYRKSFLETGKRAVLFNRFRKKYLHLTRKEYDKYLKLKNDPPKFDAYVCGSDQIWNPLIFGIDKAFFLDFVPIGKPRIAYAPSIGLPEYPEDMAESFRNLVSKLNFISCREDVGAKIIEEICNMECRVVLDPTLLISQNEWNQLLLHKTPKEKYIFCYVFSEFDHIQNYVKLIQKLTGLKVYYLPVSKIKYDSENFICVYDAGPKEFLDWVNGAEFVITDSFHCLVFSIQFKKDFFVLLRNKEGEELNMNSRMYSLLDMLGLRNRLVIDYAPSVFPNSPIDYGAVETRLDRLRNDSISYLKESLASVNDNT